MFSQSQSTVPSSFSSYDFTDELPTSPPAPLPSTTSESYLTTTPPPSNNKKKTSDVWKLATPVEWLVSQGKHQVSKASCDVCRKEGKLMRITCSRGSTKQVKKHLEDDHKEEYNHAKQAGSGAMDNLAMDRFIR
jgi:hypothetical protein